MQKPSRLAIIGFDSMTLGLLERFIAEGRLPNFERLMSRGVSSEAFCSPPPGTASNWNTIVTGTHPAQSEGAVLWDILEDGGDWVMRS